MRQTILVGLAIFLSIQFAAAQTTVQTLYSLPSTEAHPSLAIIGGYNLSTARVHFKGVQESTSYHNGFGLGVMLKSQFDGPLYFSPYVEFNQRGYGYTKNVSNVITKDQTSIIYFDIAPALTVDLPFTKYQPDGKIVFGFSPIVSYALLGTEKKKVGTGATVTKKMHFSIQSDYSIVDLGFAWSVAYHVKKGFVQLSYQLGVANIDDNAPTDKGNIENRMLSLNFGYFLK